MQEIEAKILEINRRQIEDALTKIGAAKTFDGEVETLSSISGSLNSQGKQRNPTKK